MAFIHEDFMLTGPTARELYHAHAERQPIIDYHCHLSPQEIAENIQFRDITQLWLGYDHYKWRAMRANGVVEEYITLRKRNAWEIFEKWAETVPYTMRNPLYHWTHLELKRVFGIEKILSPATAREIFEECNAKLATPEYRGQALIRRFGVEAICTTDDPADDLRWHKEIAAHPFGTKVLPTWRPDKAVAIEDPAAYKAYLERLGEAANKNIDSYADLVEALQERHDYFAQAGCKLSDHGLDTFHAADYTGQEIESIFKKVLLGRTPDATERDKFYSALLHDLAVMDAETGWVQQFHVGPIRNNCSRMLRQAGPDTGFDSILDLEISAAGNRFLDRGQDAARRRLVVPGPGERHAPADGQPLAAGPAEPVRGYAHGFAQLHQLHAPRVLPPYPLRHGGCGRGQRTPATLRDAAHRGDDRRHLLPQCTGLLWLLIFGIPDFYCDFCVA